MEWIQTSITVCIQMIAQFWRTASATTLQNRLELQTLGKWQHIKGLKRVERRSDALRHDLSEMHF